MPSSPVGTVGSYRHTIYIYMQIIFGIIYLVAKKKKQLNKFETNWASDQEI